jgi:hypothetical protein
MPPYYHLERDPLWCGMLLYNFRMVAHEGAILNANSSIFILATAHLYNSLRQAGTLPCEWPDMERIISMHRPENLFVGDRPTTFANSFKNFNLAIGMSPVMLASNQRKRSSDVLRSSRPRKSLGNLAPTLWEFKPSICDGVSRGSLGSGDVKRFMRQTVLEEAGGQSIRFDSNNDAPFILELLHAVVHLETSEITFDHFEMHIVCWRLLRELHDVLGESLEGWSEVYGSNDRTIPSIVLWLLAELVEEEQVETASRFGGLLASTDVLARVGEVVAGFIAREGGVAMKNMRGKHAVVSTI